MTHTQETLLVHTLEADRYDTISCTDARFSLCGLLAEDWNTFNVFMVNKSGFLPKPNLEEKKNRTVFFFFFEKDTIVIL